MKYLLLATMFSFLGVYKINLFSEDHAFLYKGVIYVAIILIPIYSACKYKIDVP